MIIKTFSHIVLQRYREVEGKGDDQLWKIFKAGFGNKKVAKNFLMFLLQNLLQLVPVIANFFEEHIFENLDRFHETKVNWEEKS